MFPKTDTFVLEGPNLKSFELIRGSVRKVLDKITSQTLCDFCAYSGVDREMKDEADSAKTHKKLSLSR